MGIGVGLAVASALIGTATTVAGAESRKSALEERQRQLEVAASAQKLKEDNKLERVLSSQKAVEAASPFKTTSASFGAISEDSINEFAQDRQATNLNVKYQNSAIDTQIGSIKTGEVLGVANNLFDSASMYYKLKNLPIGSSNFGGSQTSSDPERYNEEF